MLNSGYKGVREVAAPHFTWAGVATAVQSINFVYEEANDTFIQRRGDGKRLLGAQPPQASAASWAPLLEVNGRGYLGNPPRRTLIAQPRRSTRRSKDRIEGVHGSLNGYVPVDQRPCGTTPGRLMVGLALLVMPF